MEDDGKKPKATLRRQLGIILHPKNILRTIAASVPAAASVLEVQSQVESGYVADRIDWLENSDFVLQQKLEALEAAQPQPQPDLTDWSLAVGNFLNRVVSLAIVYDGGVDSPRERGKEFLLRVAHGCFVGAKEVVTCVEAMEFTQKMATYKRGRVVIIAGMAFFEMRFAQPNKTSGIVMCDIISRDERRWIEVKQMFDKIGNPFRLRGPLETPVKFSATPWQGQEIGFVHTGEAVDVMGPTSVANFQFDTAVISHFRKVKEDALKSFVTNVVPGKIVNCGIPVFGRKEVLLGVISGTESYPGDSGERLIVRSLLGHPRFTVPKS